MPNTNPQLMKWYRRFFMFAPLFTMMFTIALWVDTRYMHKNVSDIRYIELQIRLIESQIKLYNRTDDPSVDEQWKYEMDKDQLKNLMRERNKIMDIGDGS